MERKHLMLLAVSIAVITLSASAAAKSSDQAVPGSMVPRLSSAPKRELEGTRLDTMWIFDADFSTTTGDNDWTSSDRSGTLGQDNYWHHDTIRMTG